MTLVKRHDKSWLLTWTAIIVTLFLAVSLISVPTSVFGAETDEIIIPDSYFRIVDVRSNHGHLVVEAQHFNEDKTHWFYNLYSFQGSEGFNRKRVLNDGGEALLSDDTVAPYMWLEMTKDLEEGYKTDITTEVEQVPVQFIPYDTLRFEYKEDEFGTDMWFLTGWNDQFGRIDTSQLQIGMVSTDVINLLGTPDDGNIHSDKFLDLKYRASADWKYGDLKLNSTAILDVIATTHLQRLDEGWNEDRGRTILEPMPHSAKEIEGSNILRNHFTSLIGKAYKLNNNGKAGSFSGSLTPTSDYIELVEERTQHTKTYIKGNTERQIVFQENTHYQDTEGNWLPTSLDFIDIGSNTYIMGTHPTFYAMGQENSISLLANDTEYGGRWYTPSPLTYSGSNASYTHEGVTWTYELTNSGMKLTSEPLEARGEQSYEFVFYPLGEGVDPLRIDFEGNAVTGDIEVEVSEEQQGMYFYYDEIDDGPDTEPQIVIPKPYILGADSLKYDAGSWEILDDYRIGFSFDDSLLPPEAFPYSIDPTTTIQGGTSGINDASISNTYGNNGAGTGLAIGSTNSGGTAATKSLIKWNDLSSIPSDAIITKAEVQLYEFDANDSAQQGNTEAELYRVLMDWTEGGVTYTSTGSTSWGCAGLICAPWSSVDPYVSGQGTAQGYNMATSTAYTGCNCWVKFSGSRMTEDVQKWISGDYNNYGWVIATIFPKEQNGIGYSYNTYSSSEHSNGNGPKLVVTYEYESAYTCPSSELRIEEPIQDGHIAHNSGYSSAWSNFLLKKSNTTGTAGGYSATYATNYSDTNFWLGFFFHGNTGAHWAMLSRAYMAFDTSPLPDDAIITDGRLILHPTSVRDTQVNNSQLSSEFIRLVKIGNFANEDGTWNGVDADFGEVGDPEVYADNTFGDAPMAWDVGFINIIQGLSSSSTHPWDISDNSDAIHPGHPMVFNLNGPGKDWIDPTGHTGFGIRQGSEVTNFQSLTGGPISPGGDNWLKVGFTSKEHASYYKGNDMRPKLYLRYTKPCGIMDSTSSVSQTTVTTVYTTSSYEDGYITMDTPNDSWELFRLRDEQLTCNTDGTDYTCADASASGHGTSNNSISSFATGMTMHHAREYCSTSAYYARAHSEKCWDIIERAFIAFDTSALPDYYTGGCSTNTTTFYPSKDGETEHISANSSWDTIMFGNGNGSNPNGSTSVVSVNTSPSYGGGGGTGFSNIERIVVRFDTSALPSDAIPTYVRYGYVADVKGQWWHSDMMLVTHDAYTNNTHNVENADYRNFGNRPLANMMDLSFVVADDTTVNWMVMNNEGLNHIEPDGITELGMRISLDSWSFPPINASEWQADKNEYVTVYMNEAGGSQRPRLEVTYQTGCANTGVHSASIGLAANGTNKGGSWYEQSDSSTSIVRAFPGNVANPGLGDWLRYYPIKMTTDRLNSEINTDGTTYNEFVFTPQGRAYLMDNHAGASAFMVGDRHDIEDWQPDDWWNYQRNSVEWVSNEGSTAPRLMITHGDISDTIGTASLFHSAGQTLIINTAGTKLVAAGGAFDAIRQDIINGITGSLGTSVDWNTAVKANMAVTEVVRTDDDTITVTFGAFASYNPSASTETISVVIPASAHEGAQPLDSITAFSVDTIPFTFTSFTPTLSSNSASFNMTLTGNGLPEHSFTGTEDVRLIKGGESDIVCTSVSGTGGSSVVASCPVTGAVVGTWDVKATNGTGLNDTKSAALTLYASWSSTVNGGSFSESGSDYAVFAHTAVPYFTVQAFDEVDKEWDAASSPPTTIPAAAGTDGQITSLATGKDRLVVSTAANANYLWAYEFNPSNGVVSGTPDNPVSAGSIGVNDFDIGTGDNIVVAATTNSAGVYMYDIDESAAIASFWTSTIAAPGTPPTAACSAVDINHNATYVAVGCTTSPYLHVWAITNGPSGTPAWGSKVANAASLPSGAVNGVKFSADGTQIAVAIAASPYVEVYEFNGGTVGDKASNPAVLPTGIGYGVDWLKENTTGITNLAVAHATTPFVSIYNFTTSASAAGTFGSKLSNPGTLPTGTPTSVGFHPNDDTVFVGHATDPFVTTYEYTGVSDDDYRVYRYMTNFDTSYLPDDAVITSAVLSVYIDSKNATTAWDLEVQDGVNGSEPLVVGDYDYLKYAGSVIGSINSGAMTAGQYNDITLGSYGSISKTGVTQLILRHEEDVAGTTTPGLETVDIEVGGSGTFPGAACTTSTTFTSYYSNSDYSLCSSPNTPKLALTYTSVLAGVPADLEITWTNSQEAALTPDGDGIYTIEGFAKGPLIGLRNGTIEAVTYNRLTVDNAADWNFWTSTSPAEPFPYVEYLKYDIASAQKVWYQLNAPPTYRFEDRSGNANHSASMSFPLADNLTVVVDSVETSGVLPVPAVGEIANPSLLGAITTDSTFMESGSVASTGWRGMFDTASLSMGMEVDTILAVMILFIAVVLGLGAYIATGNPLLTLIGGGIAIFAGITLGALDAWVIIIYVLIGGATIGVSRSV